MHLLNKEAKIALLRDNMASNRKADGYIESNLSGIHFTEQGRCRFEKNGRRRQIGSRKSINKVDPLSIMRCLNCGDPSHLLKNFPKEVDLLKAAKSRLEYVEKNTGKKRNAHTVLLGLCQQ